MGPHGEEPGDAAAMNAAEPVRGASPHRVADEEDGDGRQLRVQALCAELGECPKQRVVARDVVDQGGRSNERHASAGELEGAFKAVSESLERLLCVATPIAVRPTAWTPGTRRVRSAIISPLSSRA